MLEWVVEAFTILVSLACATPLHFDTDPFTIVSATYHLLPKPVNVAAGANTNGKGKKTAPSATPTSAATEDKSGKRKKTADRGHSKQAFLRQSARLEKLTFLVSSLQMPSSRNIETVSITLSLLYEILFLL